MKNPRRIVIVGGVAGGASAAAKARRIDENAEIDVFERGPYISFANCGLPYFIAGEIDDRSKLIVMTPEKFWERSRVRAHVKHEVLSINRAEKTICVKEPDGGVGPEQSEMRLTKGMRARLKIWSRSWRLGGWEPARRLQGYRNVYQTDPRRINHPAARPQGIALGNPRKDKISLRQERRVLNGIMRIDADSLAFMAKMR
jgi:hypothetical protein